MISPSSVPHDLIGNETLCKKKFAKMVLAAYKYQQGQDPVVQIKLLFDVNGNVDMMRIVKNNNKTEYHKFCGISQYLPPELVTAQTDYSSELADVWVLGIFLYRMLVGRYPFIAINDKQLFQKMQYGDFLIPDNLSPGNISSL